MINHSWLVPPKELMLSSNEVHVWRANLEVQPLQAQNFEYTLSYDERLRARQYRFPHLRQRYVASRGILRAILSNYLSEAPETIHFRYTYYGKPFLEPKIGKASLHFNVTHTEDIALYVIAQARRVGIDIERYRSIPDAEAIAERFFSPREKRALYNLSIQQRQLAFLRCWTRKEAYIKAVGIGLSLPLDQFSVTLNPDEPAQLLRTDYDLAIIEHWELHELEPGQGYLAALAVEGHDLQLMCWQWPELSTKGD